jgi:tetratricopeptide (TPR) repeat protein
MRWRCAVVAFVLVALLPAPARAQLVDEHTRTEAFLFFNAGETFMSAQDFGNAAEQFIKAIGKDRLMTLAYFGLGQASMERHLFPNAIEAFQQCLAADRELYDLSRTHRLESEAARIDLIREMEDSLRRLAESKKATRPQLIRLEAQIVALKRRKTALEAPYEPPAEVLLVLGSAFFRNGERDDAETQWKAAIEVNPKLGEAHNNLAVIYMQTERFDLAEREITLAEKSGVRVNPQFKDDLKQRRAGR